MAKADQSRQLGMPVGTAHHRLRKMIMFQLVQETGRDVCFRCGEKIETADDMTVEHKKPWFGVDTGLFWDLDNIAFSHAFCNGSAARKLVGERAPTSKLTRSDVRQIKRLLVSGDYESHAAIGRRYGVSGSTISEIARGKTWTHVGVEGWPISADRLKRPKSAPKLSTAQVREIKAHLAVGRESLRQIAAHYGVNHITIYNIAHGRTYASIPAGEPAKEGFE